MLETWRPGSYAVGHSPPSSGRIEVVLLEISTWIFIVIVQVAIGASIAVLILYAKLHKAHYERGPSIAETDEDIARTKIRLQSANQLKDMYFSLKAKYMALVKAQNNFEDHMRKIIHRDDQAKLADLCSAVKIEKEKVGQKLTAIEKSLLSIAITKDDDEKAAERKVALVQETAEHIDHSVTLIQNLINQQNTIVNKLLPLINKLPDEMEAKQILLGGIAELEKVVAELDEAIQKICAQNQILQNQVETILGEQELAMRDMRKQVKQLHKKMHDQKKAYEELQTKYQLTEAEFQTLYQKHHPPRTG